MRTEEALAQLHHAAAGTSPMVDAARMIEQASAMIAAALMYIHGDGEWRIEIDHQLGYVVVKLI